MELQGHLRYRLLELIGKGGMGRVYKAVHRMMQRTVALKVIDRQLTANRQAVERFEREVQAAASLSHPNIVTAYDAEKAGDIHFLAMEYAEGVDLSKVVRQRGPISVADACDYIAQAATGLQHAHQQGLVHRDIKPHNLILTSGNTVKILDFGLASLTEGAIDAQQGFPDRADLTAAGAIMGTPDYISPEQAVDARSVDIRSDIYSLGATFHFLLAGRPSFDEGTVLEKLSRHAQADAPRIDSIRTDVPTKVADIIARMMAKDPSQRFQTPEEVADALAPFVNKDGLPGESDSTRPVLASVVLRQHRWTAALALLTIALAATFYVVTNKGTLTIETLNDDVTIVIQQGGKQIEIIDTATDSKVVRLPSGQYQIHLQGDDNRFTLDADVFELTRGSEKVVRVQLKRNAALTAAEEHPQIDDAIKTSKRWLRLIHSRKYGEAYDTLASEKMKALVSRQGFVTSTEMVRSQLGAMGLHREPSIRLIDSLPGIGSGEFMFFEWQVEFSAKGKMTEHLTLSLDDGQWKAVGYQLMLPLKNKGVNPGDVAGATIVNSIGMKLTRIPAGQFQMGSPEDEPGRKASWEKQHLVKITKPFYLGVYEVTQQQYKQVMRRDPFEFSPTGLSEKKVQGIDTSRFPAESVTWKDAAEFCRKLSELPEERSAGRSYRLPTEAEWEYACRGGTSTIYHCGDEITQQQARFEHPSRIPATVGSYPPNPLGLHDMHGNVSEWVMDWFAMRYFEESPIEDPPGPSVVKDHARWRRTHHHRGMLFRFAPQNS